MPSAIRHAEVVQGNKYIVCNCDLQSGQGGERSGPKSKGWPNLFDPQSDRVIGPLADMPWLHIACILPPRGHNATVGAYPQNVEGLMWGVKLTYTGLGTLKFDNAKISKLAGCGCGNRL